MRPNDPDLPDVILNENPRDIVFDSSAAVLVPSKKEMDQEEGTDSEEARGWSDE
jgi:hypothetical protein